MALQAGYDTTAAHLGNPLHPSMAGAVSPRAALVQSSFSQQVFDTTMQYPDMAMNERLSAYRKAPPAWMAMNVSRIPNGGFSEAPPSIIIGPDSAGGNNVRLPLGFTVPECPKARMEVGPPPETLTGWLGGETVFRQPDGKLRNAHGAMSVKRFDDEMAKGAGARVQAYDALFDGVLPPMVPDGVGAGNPGAAAIANAAYRAGYAAATQEAAVKVKNAQARYDDAANSARKAGQIAANATAQLAAVQQGQGSQPGSSSGVVCSTPTDFIGAFKQAPDWLWGSWVALLGTTVLFVILTGVMSTKSRKCAQSKRAATTTLR